MLRIQTDERGRPGEIQVRQSSGVVAVDAAAVRIGRQMIFHPALNDRLPVAVWSEVPLSF